MLRYLSIVSFVVREIRAHARNYIASRCGDQHRFDQRSAFVHTIHPSLKQVICAFLKI